jgi:hypothetical protein
MKVKRLLNEQQRQHSLLPDFQVCNILLGLKKETGS